ncbi:DUF5719 family protein [Nocardioides sp. B-3]|uniref:DUF5719 family protein n=1 Tax=Nocardioides sp. B-3 TaxID=2895565 RepID=UPI00215366D0|nr:DUF5719 family protein [Nocardioides sp. B-3]UUZ58112.1 DUF5719 family protein [Nocardioides sp. B-3]
MLANPGESEARVAVKVVTKESEFAPADADEIRVAPGSTETVDLTDLMEGRAASGALGLRLDSTQPVTASLRSFAGGDLFHAAAASPISARVAGDAAGAVAAGARRRWCGGRGDLRRDRRRRQGDRPRARRAQAGRREPGQAPARRCHPRT